MNKKLRPLIKWTGGKYDEFPLFANHIPHFERYIEPFFGGGGVFFALQPKVPAFLNDKSSDLINFYQQIGQEQFKNALLQYAVAWEEIGALNTLLWTACATPFVNFIKRDADEESLRAPLLKNLNAFFKDKPTLNLKDFIIDVVQFQTTLLASIIDKAKRIKRISKNELRVFTKKEMMTHFETGIRGGTYLFFRKILNQHYKGTIELSKAKAAANWYFVREFCYGSMFRFNAKGEFNIPYGGIAYNKKNFNKKLAHIFKPEVVQLFNEASIANLDFEVFLKRIDLNAKDFIFIDPPYDSEFSEYDQNAFTAADQQRLASFLIETKAKWMMVIKETSFIRQLYTHKGIRIVDFDKKYSYNVRGRNNREVMHLIITNYQIKTISKKHQEL